MLINTLTHGDLGAGFGGSGLDYIPGSYAEETHASLPIAMQQQGGVPSYDTATKYGPNASLMHGWPMNMLHVPQNPQPRSTPILRDGVPATPATVSMAIQEYLSRPVRPRPPSMCDADAIKLFVGNVPKQCDESTLLDVFQQLGDVVEIIVIRDSLSTESKGSAFVWYKTQQLARQAILMLHAQLALPDASGKRARFIAVRPSDHSRRLWRSAGPVSSGNMPGAASPAWPEVPSASQAYQHPASTLGLASTINPWPLQMPPMPLAQDQGEQGRHFVPPGLAVPNGHTSSMMPDLPLWSPASQQQQQQQQHHHHHPYSLPEAHAGFAPFSSDEEPWAGLPPVSSVPDARLSAHSPSEGSTDASRMPDLMNELMMLSLGRANHKLRGGGGGGGGEPR